jgi:hypothetical protein
LLDAAVIGNIIFVDCKINIGQYLAFRHFFSHSYALDIYSEKMEPLVENIQEVYPLFKKEVKKFL